MVSFHIGHTAVWLCYRKWTDKSEWCCLEGSRKIDKSSRQGLIINKNKVEIACFLKKFLSVNMYETPRFSLSQTTESPSDTIAVLNPDSLTWTIRKTTTVTYLPLLWTLIHPVLPILRHYLDLFSISERHFSRQKGISSNGISADRNLPVWGDKYRNVRLIRRIL